ncbi:MAG: hypothetical protein IKT32_05410 [Clostridia bacterium]|nr:hypothetical protein [Clostridia bacterium]
MEVPFNFFNQILQSFFKLGYTHIISNLLFVFQVAVGVLCFIIFTLSKRSRARGVVALYYLYQTCFFIDLGLCIGERLFVGKYFKSVTFAYSYSLVKFMLLIALYAVIWGYKHVLNGLFYKRIGLTNQTIKKDMILDNLLSCTTENGGAKECDFYDKKLLKDSSFCKALDINIPYVKAVIDALKVKNLTPSERERLDGLSFELTTLPSKSEESISKINEEFNFLVKQMTKYNVIV